MPARDMERTPSFAYSDIAESAPGTPLAGGDVSWQPIGQTSNQLILYHPPSHALSVQPHGTPISGPSRPLQRRVSPLLLPYRPAPPAGKCPYCAQLLPSGNPSQSDAAPLSPTLPDGSSGRTPYFRILEQAHEGSRPPSPRIRPTSPSPAPFAQGIVQEEDQEEEDRDEQSLPSKGYYERFFREEGRLGMGAEGSVFLATHIISGNVLGSYAVKKIAVGDSKDYLIRMLREVRLLETLRHPNIIPYHHAWIEPTRFSSFGAPINALHVLMMFATAGNLDTFLMNRSYGTAPSRPDLSAGALADQDSLGQLPKAERIKAFKKRRASGVNGKREETRGILFLGYEELMRLFSDVVEGLAFLHSNSILHLDLKCSNVLLHWIEGILTPRAMISDFGTSEEMLKGKRERSGHTGTMEYMAPETIVKDARDEWRPSDSHADMWSLGMILYKMVFLHMPYSNVDDFDVLHADILRYPGFIPSPELIKQCERRHVPRDMLLLLSKLVNVDPESRPSAERVRVGLRSLQQQYTATSRSMNSDRGVVARFTRPLANLGQSLGVGNLTQVVVVDEQNTTRISPIRSPLALTSPETPIEPSLSATPPGHARSTSSQLLHPSAHILDPLLQHLAPPADLDLLPATLAQRWKMRVSRARSALQPALLLAKIISLQPDVIGLHLPIWAVVGLTVLALYTAQPGRRRWQMTLAGVLAHAATLWALSRSGAVGGRLHTAGPDTGVGAGSLLQQADEGLNGLQEDAAVDEAFWRDL